MQNKLLITVPTIILIIILTLTLHVSFVNASIVTLSMDRLPENEGWIVYKQGNVTSSVSNGILTIENNGSGHFAQLIYSAPDDWKNTVNSTKGWIVEFRLKLEQRSSIEISIRPGQEIRVSDHSIRFIDDPAGPEYLMNTTDIFHVYRIESKGDLARVFVDEKLVLDGPYAYGINPYTILFGSRSSYSSYSKSYWDYISYDTNPNERFFTSPALIVIDGISSYYISNLSGVTVDNSLIVIPNGTYAGWCIDKSVRMIRNEANNIILYSSTQYVLVSDIRQYNWSSVNYILNHKQGTMQEIQDAIWYFVPDFVTPSSNETITWNMINAAKANSNYVPGKGDIMAIIAYAGHSSGTSTSGSGIQNTILEYRIP